MLYLYNSLTRTKEQFKPIDPSHVKMYVCGQTDNFDIHGGGLDLQFPHHENEIAQSESFTGKPPANYWLHNGLVQIDDLKIGNSNGNRIKISDITNHEALRLYILQTHYRSPLKFDMKGLDDAAKALTRLYSAFDDVPDIPFQDITSKHTKRFLNALNNDLNTTGALAVLFDLARDINVLKSTDDDQHAAGLVRILKQLGGVLGLFQKPILDKELSNEAIELIRLRNVARQAKNWIESDRLRDKLLAMGITVKDSKI